MYISVIDVLDGVLKLLIAIFLTRITGYDKLMAYDSKITLYWGRADKAQKRYEQLAGLTFEYIPLDRLPGLAKPEA